MTAMRDMEQEDPIDGALLWAHFHAIKQDVRPKLGEIIAGDGARIAFPTRTLHLPDEVRVDSEKATTGAGLAADGIR